MPDAIRAAGRVIRSFLPCMCLTIMFQESHGRMGDKDNNKNDDEQK